MRSTGIKKMENSPLNPIDTRVPSINKFFNEEAFYKMTNMDCTVYEFWWEGLIIGFITVSMNKLFYLLPETEKSTTYPAVLIGQLGVDKHYNRKVYADLHTEESEYGSFGEELVDYGIALAFKLSNHIGCRLVFVEIMKIENDNSILIENEELVDYYINYYGFERAITRIKEKTHTILYYDLKSAHS